MYSAILTPPSEGYNRTPEYFSGRMNVVFDALSAVEAGAAQSSLFLFDAARINRLAWQHAIDGQQQLGVRELFQQVFKQTWQRNRSRCKGSGRWQYGTTRF